MRAASRRPAPRAGYAVILAGGRGERFWPRSRPGLPKQFLRLGGEGSLLQITAERAARLAGRRKVLVVTAAAYGPMVRAQLPWLDEAQVVTEPVGRDTAAAIGLAATIVAQRAARAGAPPPVMAVMPADHAVGDEAAFCAAMNHAMTLATREPEALLLLGVRPTRAEPGFGYIRLGEPALRSPATPVFAVEAFVEKPPRQVAEALVRDGRHLWNTGVFVWRADTILAHIGRHLPRLRVALETIGSALGTPWQADVVAREYARLDRVSIDRGVLERARTLRVIPAEFGWDDVGSWDAVGRLRPADASGNSLNGPVVVHDAADCIVEADSRPVAVVGVSGLVVVDGPEGILVCARERAQEVRRAAERLCAAQDTGPGLPGRPHPDPEPARVVPKPWGREIWWAVTPSYAGKVLEIRAGHALSLQYHERKLETLYVQSGTGELVLDGRSIPVRPGVSVTVPAGTLHRLVAATDLVVLEVSTPHLDDVVRVEDRYGRVRREGTGEGGHGGRRAGPVRAAASGGAADG